MRTSIQLFNQILIPFTVISAIFISCSNDDEQNINPENSMTISEVVATTPELSLLHQALVYTELEIPLNRNGKPSYALLAPTNQAFQAFLEKQGITRVTEIEKEILTKIMQYHLLDGPQTTFYLTSGYKKTLLKGPDNTYVDLHINNDSEITFNLNATLIQEHQNIEASNGIVHQLNALLLPPTVVDQLLTNPDFSSMATAARRIQDDLNKLFEQDPPLTIMVPSDESFESLIKDLGFESLDQMDNETILQIFQFHILKGNLDSKALGNGKNLRNYLNQSLLYSSDVWGPFIAEDPEYGYTYISDFVQASNGVLMMVSHYLRPPALLPR